MNQDIKKFKKIEKVQKKLTKNTVVQEKATSQLQRHFQLEIIQKQQEKKQISFCHWNVNGFRAIYKKKDFQQFIKQNNFDIICLSETKINSCTLQQSKLHQSKLLQMYNQYWSFSTVRKGYSGCAIFSKIIPLNILYGIDEKKFDDEGRFVTLEFEDFFIVNVYVPNSKNDLSRLDERTKEFDVKFRQFLKNLKQKKAVIVVGDFNVANEDIDVYNPKNQDKVNGFTNEERKSFQKTLKDGFVDIWREQNPQKQGFSWWDYRFQMRDRNMGWRLDYVIVDKENQRFVQEVKIRDDVKGSDHCPITGILNLDKLKDENYVILDQIINFCCYNKLIMSSSFQNLNSQNQTINLNFSYFQRYDPYENPANLNNAKFHAVSQIVMSQIWNSKH